MKKASSAMTITSRFLAPAALLLAVAAGSAVADQKDSAVFDLTLKGIHAGTLSISGAIEGRSYAVSGVLKSGGLVALVRKIRYDARAYGTVADGRFTPSRYEEDADTGKRQSQSVMDYKAGVPQVKVYNPPKSPRPGDVDAATQGGTIDPLTALYAALRDVPAAEACNQTLALFDGRRKSQVVLSDPRPVNGGTACAGEYRRLEGFSEREMADKSRFPFTMTYATTGDGRLRVTEISMDTIYGKGRLKRR
ncbi:DUF3108 domain-containing protein [Defluviimonas sp. SAOS-178_SWC]|uniref:DUF3108 domain-containing protein n=1 Tax=Defluviimonas sp. SAOS-178_SWC TaxID=3121287 RepID=UPI0032220307